MDKAQNEKIDTIIKFFKGKAVPMTVEDIGSVINYLEKLKSKQVVEEDVPVEAKKKK